LPAGMPNAALRVRARYRIGIPMHLGKYQLLLLAVSECTHYNMRLVMNECVVVW
jgi:hypothetical protein